MSSESESPIVAKMTSYYELEICQLSELQMCHAKTEPCRTISVWRMQLRAEYTVYRLKHIMQNLSSQARIRPRTFQPYVVSNICWGWLNKLIGVSDTMASTNETLELEDSPAGYHREFRELYTRWGQCVRVASNMLTRIGWHHPDVLITGMSKILLIPVALKQPLDVKAEQDKKKNNEVWHLHHHAACTSFFFYCCVYFVFLNLIS